ncbi:MAG TPA: hypothetical protein VE844_03535, partial [Gammaproteobacteria bacterium]|nr:hypothetical protein [Gammaproteobacteria bacterium]
LWAAMLNDMGNARWAIGIRTKGTDIHQHLAAAVKFLRAALEVYTREHFPPQWEKTQRNLTLALEALDGAQAKLPPRGQRP